MSTSNTRPIAVVTGASSGIGAVYADRLAGRGHDLVLVARRQDRLAALARRLEADHGAAVETVVADLTRDDDLVRVERVLAENPRVAVLVNNAGNGRVGASVDISAADTDATIALNVTALTRLSRAVLPGFLQRDRGTIVNIASAVAVLPFPATSLYSGSKAFVFNYSQGLQQEVQGTGVRVQVVLPAATATEFFDHAGVPLSAFDPAVVMDVDDMVDAALAGLDQGEPVTLPSLDDAELWTRYRAAAEAIFEATQTGRPAPRYRGAGERLSA